MILSDIVKMRMCNRTHVLNKCVRALPSFQRGVFDFLVRFIKTPCSRGTSRYIKLAVGHMSVCMSVYLCSPPMGWPRTGIAHGLHWQTNGLREHPEFQRIPTINIQRTCMHARINSTQIRERRSARPSK